MNERMNAILDVLEPQRSEKGTGLRKVTEAKEKLARELGEPGQGGWGSRELWELLWLMNEGLRSGMENQTLPILSQINIQAAIVLIETGFRSQIMLTGWGTTVRV